MPRIVVQNSADGGFFYWLIKFYVFGALALALTLSSVVVVLLLWLDSHAPKLDAFRNFRAVTPISSRVFAWDGQLLGEFAHERRDLVEINDMPPLLVQAFLAAEDRRFYDHRGVDFRGVARAAWANARAGMVLQGGSTITQQVAKAFLGSERTMARKLREMVVALRLEHEFSKREILFLYLNTIFLGHGSYGVGAAAKRYFDRDVGTLSVDQMALLAGLARGPVRYSPIQHPDRARYRRNGVLDLMQGAKMISAEVTSTAKAQPLGLVDPHDVYRERAPQYTEAVRRLVVEQVGEHAFYEGGLVVETAADLHVQSLAADSVDEALRKLDKRQGWRGPVAHLRDGSARAEFLARARAAYPEGASDPQRVVLALVEEVTPASARVWVGRNSAHLNYAGLSWAAPYRALDGTNDRIAASISSVITPGDVVWVRPKAAAVVLEQEPRVEGAITTFDHQTGYELAHVGGRDFERSSFDRISQACRQPGSTFKPIYYSLALDRGHGMNEVLQDKPYVPEPGEVWDPRNIHGTLDGHVTLWAALVRSLNLPSIQLLTRVGAQQAADWARRLGLTTPIFADRALALGASCTRLVEMARAFALFARGGTWIDPSPIRRVLDRNGQILLDNTEPLDPWIDAVARIDRTAARLGERPRRVIDERTAYLTSQLLRDAVVYGIAARAGTIGAPVAGKGGTSSDTMDVSFIGYTSRWLTAAWIGDDTYERPLGSEDASYSIVIPMWARYMKAAIGERPHKEIPWQAHPKGLVSIEVDPATGEAALPGAFATRMWVRSGEGGAVR